MDDVLGDLEETQGGLRDVMATAGAFALTSVLALAAAIAVACMGYTFIEQMVSATLPFPNGARFVRIEIDAPGNSEMPRDAELLEMLRDQALTLEHVAGVAIAPGELSLILDNGEVAGVRAADAWLPFDATVDRARVIGIMRDGVTTQHAQSEVQTTIARVTRTADSNDPVRVRVVPFTTPNGGLRPDRQHANRASLLRFGEVPERLELKA